MRLYIETMDTVLVDYESDGRVKLDGEDYYNFVDDKKVKRLPVKCAENDKSVTALLRDLKQRGLLDETLVVWGGEFGRTAMNEKRNGSKFLGRDHHPDCFTIWMAGGGLRHGITHGETDELGYTVARDPVHVHDLQATILHLLGLDPFTLSYRYQGLDQRLIGVEDTPKIINGILA